MNQAFLVSFAATLLLTFAAIPFGRRRPKGRPVSWGEALLAGTYVFGVMFLAFGVVPHQWIDHAAKDLGWSKTKLLFGPGGILKPQSAGGWNPITLQYEALRDVIVVVIHAVFFGLIIFMWNWWQTRDARATVPELETSSYGRPLVRRT